MEDQEQFTLEWTAVRELICSLHHKTSWFDFFPSGMILFLSDYYVFFNQPLLHNLVTAFCKCLLPVSKTVKISFVAKKVKRIIYGKKKNDHFQYMFRTNIHCFKIILQKNDFIYFLGRVHSSSRPHVKGKSQSYYTTHE